MDDIDAEVAALAEFQRRTTRGRLAVGVPCIGLGLAGGVAAFWWIQSRGPGGPAGLALGVLAFAAPFAASLFIGVVAARRYTAGQKDAWLAALAREHGVDEQALRDRAQMFE